MGRGGEASHRLRRTSSWRTVQQALTLASYYLPAASSHSQHDDDHDVRLSRRDRPRPLTLPLFRLLPLYLLRPNQSTAHSRLVLHLSLRNLPLLPRPSAKHARKDPLSSTEQDTHLFAMESGSSREWSGEQVVRCCEGGVGEFGE